jgi:excinuclease ABC subunit B
VVSRLVPLRAHPGVCGAVVVKTTNEIEITGRAARNSQGRAILYADKMTMSITKVINETNRRREIQRDYNTKHGIIPQTIVKELKPLVDPALISTQAVDFDKPFEYGDNTLALSYAKVADDGIHYKPNAAMKEVVFEDKGKLIEHLRDEMMSAARNMDFEEAARIRDQIGVLEKG